jgi:two-component system, NarL family, sensor kinase
MQLSKPVCLFILLQMVLLQSIFSQPAGNDFEKLRFKVIELATTNPDSAELYAKKLMEMAALSKSDQLLANALNTMALVKIWQSLPDEALRLNEQSLTINSRLSNADEIADNYTNAALTYQNKSDFIMGTKFYIKSLAISEKNKLYSLTQKNYRGLSNISSQQNDLIKALDYAFKALEIEKLHPDDKDRANDWATLAPCYTLLKKPDSAKYYYDKAYRLYAEEGNQFKMASLLCQVSIIYEESDPVKSLEMELEGQKLYDRITPENAMSVVNIGNIGESYFSFAQDDSIMASIKNPAIPNTKAALLAEAEKYLKRCLLLSGKKKIPYFLIHFTGILAGLQAYTGDYKNAYSNLQYKYNLNDSLFSQKNKNAIARLQSEKEVLELTAVNKQKATLNKILAGTAFGFLLLGFLGYRNFRNKQKVASQQEQIQRQKITELEKEKQLLAVDAMLKGQEEERSRIAKDLHDGLGGMLSGTKLSFITMKENLVLTPENAALFDKSINMLDNSIGDLRKVAHNLMPEALVKFGLNEAVRDFCDSVSGSSELVVIYQQLGEQRKLNSTAEVFTYRIIQELINNAIKHAGAKKIFVQLTTAPDKLSITVEDDGKGFSMNDAANSKGAGLSNIKYRVQYLNGTIDIVTAPGNGTSVNIELKAPLAL